MVEDFELLWAYSMAGAKKWEQGTRNRKEPNLHGEYAGVDRLCATTASAMDFTMAGKTGSWV